MKNRLNSLFDFLNNQKQQTFLKRLNNLLAVFCIFLILNNFENINVINVSLIDFKILEIILTLIFYMNSGTLWSKFMQSNYKGRFRDYFFNWSYSKMGKYIPSGIMTLSVRVNQNFNKKQNQKILFFGLLEEQFLIPFIAIPPLIVTLLSVNQSLKPLFLFVSIILMFIFVKVLYAKFNNSYFSMLKFNFLFLVNYLIPILLFHEIARNLNHPDPFSVSMSYFLATCIGLFFIGVPAGIGIREFIFLGYVNNFLSDTSLLTIIIKIRIIFIFFDIVFGLLGLIYSKFSKKK